MPLAKLPESSHFPSNFIRRQENFISLAFTTTFNETFVFPPQMAPKSKKGKKSKDESVPPFYAEAKIHCDEAAGHLKNGKYAKSLNSYNRVSFIRSLSTYLFIQQRIFMAIYQLPSEYLNVDNRSYIYTAFLGYLYA